MSAGRVHDDLVPAGADPDAGILHGPGAAATSAPAVVLEHATARLGGRDIWCDVDLELPAGEFVAILGPNGAGKSTLIKAILGLVPLAEGHALVLGGRPAGDARQEIGYLPQRRAFDRRLHVRGVDVVRLGLDGDRWGVPLPRLAGRQRAGTAAARVDAVIAQVGASGYATRPIGQLSGGEQQRLLLAQAMIRNPRLLLLDEPLDSLDLPNQAAMAALIARLTRDRGITVLMVAHDVNPILADLDRVVYVARGRVVAGAPDEVITSETLTRLYGTPVEVLRTADGRPVVVGHPEAPALHSDRHGDARG